MKRSKIIVFLIFIFIMGINIYSKGLKEIRSISMKINEISFLNKNKKEKEYKIDISFPDKIRKEMISPEINKGEIYLYKGQKKTVYYPLLEQSIESEIENEENYVFFVLKKIREIESEKIDGSNVLEKDNISYIFENNKIMKMDFGDGDVTKFVVYDYFNGYHIPVEVEVYTGEKLISEIKIYDINIDQINEEIFVLE